MAYSQYDSTKPATTSLGTALPAEVLVNTNAVRDFAIMGQAQGYAFSTSGGTAEEPQYWIFTKSASDLVRATPTWSSGKVTACKWERYNGSTYDSMLSADQAFTYDGSGNLTAVSNASGMLSLFFYALAKLKSLYTSYTAHNGGAVGTYHSGVGTIASQAANSVAITGGAIDGTAIGGTTRAAVAGKTFKGEVVALGSISGSQAVDWSAGDYFTMTFSGAGAALTWSNLPNGVAQGITLEITNAGVATSPWPAGTKFPLGAAPTRTASGIDLYELVCRDGSTVRLAQAHRDSK